MAGRRHDREPGLAQHGLQRCRTFLVPLTFGLAGLEMPNAGKTGGLSEDQFKVLQSQYGGMKDMIEQLMQ